MRGDAYDINLALAYAIEVIPLLPVKHREHANRNRMVEILNDRAGEFADYYRQNALRHLKPRLPEYDTVKLTSMGMA
jgi:hypothetical protein